MVHQTAVVCSILRRERDGIVPVLEQARWHGDAESPFVLPREGDVSEGNSVQRDRDIVRKTGNHTLQYDLKSCRLSRSRIKMRHMQHLINRRRGHECAEEVVTTRCK